MLEMIFNKNIDAKVLDIFCIICIILYKESIFPKSDCNYYSMKMLLHVRKTFKLFPIFADSLESANSSILAAHRHFKEVVGKKSGFYDN